MTSLLRFVGTALAVMLVCAGAARAASAGPQADRTSVVRDFIADVVVERLTVQADGAVAQRLPMVRYRLSQRQGPRGLRTEIHFQASPPFPGRGPLQDPSAGFRVVMGEAEGIRVFDPSGAPLTSPGPSNDAGAASPEDAQATSTPVLSELAVPRSGDARRRSLVARYGPSVGRVRRHERFVRLEDDVVEEVLIDPDTALPVEMNTAQAGRLLAKSSMSYASLPDGRLYRAAQRDETLVDPAVADGLRNVTITTYTPVVSVGGAR